MIPKAVRSVAAAALLMRAVQATGNRQKLIDKEPRKP